MHADKKSALQRPKHRSWTLALVRRAMRGYEVEAAVLDMVTDRIMSTTTTRDPDYVLRSRRYTANSQLLMEPKNWKRFEDDVWTMVSWARAYRDHQLFNKPESDDSMVDVLNRQPTGEHWSYHDRQAFLTAEVGDVVNGYVKTLFGWI